MARAPRSQTSMFDREIADAQLEALLAEELRLEPDAAAYRAARQAKRQYLEEQHPDLIADGVNTADSKGWIRCGQFRFKPRKTEREAGEVRIGSGVNFTCPVERID